MTIGYDTIEKHNFIEAGTHRYDRSVRPQILEKKSNKTIKLIVEFYKKKNSSFIEYSLNLHGYPIASTIKEVLNTFQNSDLKFLYVNDNFLAEKKMKIKVFRCKKCVMISTRPG